MTRPDCTSDGAVNVCIYYPEPTLADQVATWVGAGLAVVVALVLLAALVALLTRGVTRK